MKWQAIYQMLCERGFATLPGLLSPNECEHLSGLFNDTQLFRTTIDMERFRFGKGAYKYFDYPLPLGIQGLRESFYPPLAILANEWSQQLSLGRHFPPDHRSFIEVCKANGQGRSTPLILRYEAGGFNTLHQDLNGSVFFPFQVVVVLSDPEIEFQGGEFVLVEQVPRAQSRVNVIRPRQGEAVIFTTRFRPVKGERGYYRAAIKHGISPLTSGLRYALGIIFHDAA